MCATPLTGKVSTQVLKYVGSCRSRKVAISNSLADYLVGGFMRLIKSRDE